MFRNLQIFVGLTIARSDPLCRPVDACWPPLPLWSLLNSSLDGHLEELGGGLPCTSTDETERSATLNCMMYANCEHAECSLHKPRASPQYAVVVNSPTDFVEAVRFAAAHHIRITTRGTGHDFLGRSTAEDGLLIWTHEFRDIEVIEHYRDACTLRAGPAVRVQAGAQWQDVYPAVEKANASYQIVGGSCGTVGAAGGFLQGGGHSALSPSLGLAVDSVLALEVVTMDGTLRTVSPCSDADLFFALRGGGGNTFGVVVSVLYKLHHAPNQVVGLHWMVQLKDELGSLTQWAADFMQVYTDFQASDLLWGGTLTMEKGWAIADLVLNRDDWESAVRSTASLRKWHDQTLAIFPESGISWAMHNHSTFWQWHESMDTHLPVGLSSVQSSRLMPDESLQGDTGRALVKTILSYAPAAERANHTGVTGFMQLVKLGGAVVDADPNSTTAISPAFRRANWHMVNAPTYELDVDEPVATAIVQGWRDELLQLAPDAGVYVNEMARDEPNWQHAIWGPLYDRLLAIKHTYDPYGLLRCHPCVGSETLAMPTMV